MPALTRTPIVPEATLVGALSAQLRRPRPRSVCSLNVDSGRPVSANSGHSPRVLRAVEFNPTSSSSKAQAQLSAGLFGETGRAGLSGLCQPARRVDAVAHEIIGALSTSAGTRTLRSTVAFWRSATSNWRPKLGLCGVTDSLTAGLFHGVAVESSAIPEVI